MTTLDRRQLLRATAVLPAAGLAATALETTVAGATGSVSPATPKSLRLALASDLHRDMVGHHAGLMHGVPSSYTWATQPRLVLGSHPGANTAMNPWGAIYESADGSPATNVRVACKDISGWILSRKTFRWHQVGYSHGVFGANYAENFVDNRNYPAPLRREPDGSWSSTLGNGLNFHLFPRGPRVVFDPADLAGVITMYSARVIVDDPAGPDERAAARYLALSGADYWPDATSDPSPGVDSGVGVGKARWVTPEWKTMTMSTVSHGVLKRTCPELKLRGR